MSGRSRVCLCAALVGLSLIMSANQAAAQGFTPAKGSVWTKVGYSYMSAKENFAGLNERVFISNKSEDGARVPFRSRSGQVVGGELYGHQTTLDAVWAPVDRLVVGGFVPMLGYLRYSNETNNYTTKKIGVGDIQLFTGYQISPRDQSRLGVSVYGRVKVPTGTKMPYTNEAILSEGQLDVSGALAVSFALLPRLHLNTMVEYRHRFAYDADDGYADPGEELHMQATLGGGPLDWVWFTAGYAGFVGQAWQVGASSEQTQRLLQRQFHAAMFGAYVDIGSTLGVAGLALDGWLKVPFAGRDHAVTTSMGLGVAYAF